MPKIHLTDEQRAAYDKLTDALQGIVDLTAGDTEAILAWLKSSSGGPIGVRPSVVTASFEAIESIHNYDDRTFPDDRTLWDEQVERRLLKAG